MSLKILPPTALAIARSANPMTVSPYEEKAYTNHPWPDNAAKMGYLRSITPEYLLGDGCLDARHSICDKSRRIPPFSSNAPILTRQVDYNSIGVIGQGRAVAESLYAQYANQGDRFAMVVAGTSATATFNSDADNATTVVESLGFVLDFGISLLAFAPFDLTISTDGFRNKTASQATLANVNNTVDRNITVRVNQPNGGSIWVPWAHRIAAPIGTMQDALLQVGVALPQAGETPANVSTISVTGLPAALAASFSGSIQFMTAGSPVTAAWADEVGLYRGLDQVVEVAE